MADTRFRIAERSWLSEGTRDAWVAYLREARRVGNPVFTAQDVIISAINMGPMRFKPTEDGFIASVIHATNPPIERIYQVPLGPDDYEEESFPVWSWWSGKIVVKWDNDFDLSGCPALEIKVEGCDTTDELDIWNESPITPEELTLIGEHLYEETCVTNREELHDALHDWDNWLFSD